VMERVTKVKMIFYSSERWESRSGRVTKVKMIFYSSERWKLGSPRRVAAGGGMNSMLQF
jgi:hypothetical protein